jgi:hypothetical protein
VRRRRGGDVQDLKLKALVALRQGPPIPVAPVEAPLSNRAAPAHTRSEVRRKKGRVNVVAETQKAQNRGVPWRAYQLYVHSVKATLAAMYLRRVRVVGRAAVGSIRSIDGLYLASI